MSWNFFCLPRNWICLLQNYFSSYVHLKDIYKTLKGIAKIQFVSELTILLNLQISKFSGGLQKEKNWNFQSLNTTPYVRKLIHKLSVIHLLTLSFTVFEEQCLAQRFCKLSASYNLTVKNNMITGHL